MTIKEIKDIIKDIPTGSKGLAMGHPINEDVNYHLQQLLLKWEFDSELFNEVLTTLAYIIHSGFISGYQNRYGDNLKPPTNVYHRMTA